MCTMLQEDSNPNYDDGQWARRGRPLNFERKKEILKSQ